MKVTFISPRVSLDYTGPRAKIYPPLGILSLATYLKLHLGDSIDIHVVDEVIQDVPAEAYKNDVVCIGVNSFNYENGLRHVTNSKAQGAMTILGGPHATVLPEKILALRPEVDFVITHEGEVGLLQLLKNHMEGTEDYSRIPNLYYRKNGEIRSSGIYAENDLRELPTLDRSYLPMEAYISNYQKGYQELLNKIKYRRPASIYSSKGCSWRDKSKGGCIFCARLEKNVRFRKPEDIWSEISTLVKKHNVDHIWDISDDNLNDIEWFKTFVSLKPNDIEPKFFIYTRAGAIKEEIVDCFKRLNVLEVYIGFESGDKDMLRSSRKGISIEQNFRAIELISQNGMYVYPSFVVGLPGESEESLRNTYHFAKKITEACNYYRISSTILIPIPGSQSFNMLINHEKLREKDYINKDIFDLKDMEREWTELFTKVDYDTLQKYNNTINNLSILK